MTTFLGVWHQSLALTSRLLRGRRGVREANTPFAGFGKESAIPLRGYSGARVFAHWAGAGASLPRRLLGIRVKLRFTLRGAAKLYGFALASNASAARRQRRRPQSQPTAPVRLEAAPLGAAQLPVQRVTAPV